MKWLSNYLWWHYTRAPISIIQITGNYLIFFFHFFSVRLLISNLFSPWKRKTLENNSPGYNFKQIANITIFNLISRTIGLAIRLATLYLWFIIEIGILFLGSITFLVWIILLGITIPLFIFLGPKSDPADVILKKTKGNTRETFLLTVDTSMAKFVFSRLGISLKTLHLLVDNLAEASPIPLPLQPPLENVFFQLAKNWPPFRIFLADHNLDENDILNCCRWFAKTENDAAGKKRFWELDILLRNPGIGKDWIYGYTPNLDQYSFDLGQSFSYSSHLIGRQKTSEQIERILSRTQGNNLLLVGQPGVGKQTILLNFAKRIREGKNNSTLAFKRVLSLEINKILGSFPSPAQSKNLLGEIIHEAGVAGNIILVINNIDNYLNGSNQTDLSDFLTSVLRDERIQIIGTTTPDNFQKYIYPNQQIMKYFEKVEVAALDKNEALEILQDSVSTYEKRNHVYILYQAIVKAVERSDQYVVDIPFPEKAIDLLDETCAYVSTLETEKPLGGVRLVTPAHIDIVLAEKAEIPLGDIQNEEAEKLTNLEAFLHRRIINQNEAITAIAKALRRTRLGISSENKPLGSFLFLGPTGVGKTETAKALAACYFGSERRMIRFDMAEYQGEVGLLKALGAPSTSEPGIFVKEIRDNPFSVLLLDEIEKTDNKILNLFLTMLDEGFFTDNFGKKVDCRNLIIIGTSNAGSEFIREKINTSDNQDLNMAVLEYVQKEKLFLPEFVNRFDAVVVYRPLTPENLRKIARLMLEGLNRRLAEKQITLKITDKLIARVADLGYQPAFGARPMTRVIQDKIEDTIAQGILKGTIKKGQEIVLEI